MRYGELPWLCETTQGCWTRWCCTTITQKKTSLQAKTKGQTEVKRCRREGQEKPCPWREGEWKRWSYGGVYNKSPWFSQIGIWTNNYRNWNAHQCCPCSWYGPNIWKHRDIAGQQDGHSFPRSQSSLAGGTSPVWGRRTQRRVSSWIRARQHNSWRRKSL